MSTPEKEQAYFNLLTRTDHPVFEKTCADVTTFDKDTPFNWLLNLLVAKQFCKLKDAMDEVKDNQLPDTVRESGIDRWEEALFGFTKPQVGFDQRKEELNSRYVETITMSTPDVVLLAEQITGVTPTVIRNAFFSGWVLSDPVRSVLGTTTLLRSSDQANDSNLYFVLFNEPVDSQLLQRLDEELTLIEKAGSRHIISAPPNIWVLGQGVLGIDTILG